MKAETDIRREKDNMMSALATAPVPMLVFGENEVLLSANPAAEELFGQRAAGLVGRRCGDFIACYNRHRDSRGCGYTDACPDCLLYAAIRGALAAQGGQSGEVHLVRDIPMQPTWVTYKVNSVLLDGQRCAIMALDDVTPRKQAEEALVQERLLLRTVIDNLPDSVYAKDHTGRKTLANRADLDFMGAASESEILGKTDLEVFSREVAEPLVADDRQVLQTGRAVRDREELVADHRGNAHWLLTSKYPLRDASGHVIGLVGTGRDITDRRQAQVERRQLLDEIQAQALQLQQVLETMPHGVLMLDDDGHILLANPVAERDLTVLAQGTGDRVSALGDHSLAELFTSPPKGLWHEVQVDGRAFEIISRPITRSGQPSSGHWVMVINDTTEMRRVRDQLQQQAQLAAVGQLAAGIAHDFNNIMAVIILYARMTEASPGLPERDRERLSVINQQAYHATKLIEQMLDFSRSSGLDRRPLDLVPLVKEHVKLLQRTLPESIAVSRTFDGDDPYLVEGDVTRLQQVLLNLAINSRDAMPNGGELCLSLSRVVTSRARPPVPGMPPRDWVKLAVSDTGTGISDEILPHIFEPFHTTKAPGEGTGLGLAQVHGLVRQHEGYIAVETATGVGTTFSIYLPALATGNSLEAPSDDQDVAYGHGEVVLIVEDNTPLRTALRSMLLQWHYQVREAANGQQALALLDAADSHIDIVLSDAVMPVMGGPALAQTLHGLGSKLPIILMSGHAEAQPLDELRALGVQAWLPKPLQLDELARTLSAVCRDMPDRG